MRKTIVSIAVAILANFVLLLAVHNQTPPAAESTFAPGPDQNPPPKHCFFQPCRPAFANSWDGVHQFVIGDDQMGHADLMTGTVHDIADLLKPEGAKLDFVWGGGNYANCWAGDDVSCSQDLPDNPQHPIVGHYIPFFGIGMVYGYARCVDDSDCKLACPDEKPCKVKCRNGQKEVPCHPLPSDTCKVLDPFLPVTAFHENNTQILGIYTDAAGHQEKVCRPKVGQPALNPAQQQAVEFSYWHRTHPTWLLYKDADDTTPNSVSWDGGGPPLDVSNEAVAKEVLGRIENWPFRHYYGAV